MAMTAKQIRALPDNEVLVKIMEEAGEVIQATAKLYRHGPAATFAGVVYDNRADVLEEARQLRAFVRELERRSKRRPGRPKRRVRSNLNVGCTQSAKRV